MEFQTLYSDEAARNDIIALTELKAYSVLPMPVVSLSREDEAAIALVQNKLSVYAETAMARFVTGDVPLNDEQWAVFCDTVKKLGLDEMIEIWQKYIEKKRKIEEIERGRIFDPVV